MVVELRLFVIARCFGLRSNLERSGCLVELQVQSTQLLIDRQVAQSEMLLLLLQVDLDNIMKLYDLNGDAMGHALDKEDHRNAYCQHCNQVDQCENLVYVEFHFLDILFVCKLFGCLFLKIN